MMTFKRIFLLFVTLYATLFFVVTNFFSKDLKMQDDSVFMASKTFLLTQEDNGFEIPQPPVQNKTESRAVESPKYLNPFELLGAYPDPAPYIKKSTYNKPHYGLINEDDYCYQVDLYNLANPANMFKKMNFYTDYSAGSLMKARVMNRLGTIYMTPVHRFMSKKENQLRKYQFDRRVTAFHVAGDGFYFYHEIGKHYLCATQIFNHIVNHTSIIRKDAFLQSFADYSLMYKDKPQCFDKNSFFPTTYRLFVKNECQEFFKILKSTQYQKSLKTEPIQYLLKVGHGAHRAQGVFLIDDKKTKELNNDYDSGKKCGTVNKALIAQKYIANPLLLDLNNKFHMRVYLLIASTNPFIAYYHDGYIRGSIFPFDKSSSHRATHLTNLPITSKTPISKTINGMNAKQLEDYYLWSFEDLQNYLLESGKTTDKKWLDNHLRPALQKAFVHVVRMTGGSFWKQSNVYELLGCDFMLDDEMNVWFIEANPSPLLDGVRPKMMANMLKNMFEIEYAYYRSRMKRVIAVLHRLGEGGDLDKLKGMYQKAVKNRLEPEYQIKKTNTFKLIMDESLPGAKAYLGYLPEECV